MLFRTRFLIMRNNCSMISVYIIKPINSRGNGAYSRVSRRSHGLGRKEKIKRNNVKVVERNTLVLTPSASSAASSLSGLQRRHSSSLYPAVPPSLPVHAPPRRRRPSSSSYLTPSRHCSHPKASNLSRLGFTGKKGEHPSMLRLDAEQSLTSCLLLTFYPQDATGGAALSDRSRRYTIEARPRFVPTSCRSHLRRIQPRSSTRAGKLSWIQFGGIKFDSKDLGWRRFHRCSMC
ncbi:hypothetical protein ACQJBY_032796 [Aegilops geniculata]